MEVSSHALVQHRVDAVRFAAGVFTNLTPEHLDYHRTMDEYFDAKALLFDPGRVGVAVVNRADAWGQRLARALLAATPVRSRRSRPRTRPTSSWRPTGSRFTWDGSAHHHPPRRPVQRRQRPGCGHLRPGPRRRLPTHRRGAVVGAGYGAGSSGRCRPALHRPRRLRPHPGRPDPGAPGRPGVRRRPPPGGVRRRRRPRSREAPADGRRRRRAGGPRRGDLRQPPRPRTRTPSSSRWSPACAGSLERGDRAGPGRGHRHGAGQGRARRRRPDRRQGPRARPGDRRPRSCPSTTSTRPGPSLHADPGVPARAADDRPPPGRRHRPAGRHARHAAPHQLAAGRRGSGSRSARTARSATSPRPARRPWAAWPSSARP